VTTPMTPSPRNDPRYLYFFDDAEFVPTDRDGFRRRVVTGEHLELWFWRIAGGSIGSFMHQHEANEQLGIIMRGTLDFRIGDPDDDTRHQLGAGDMYLAHPSVWHGDSIFVGDDELNEVWILDIFSPPRQEKITVRPDAAATPNSQEVAS
jgi:mannose-6-phosphate isomerase-like protein (cupin superfamily)